MLTKSTLSTLAIWVHAHCLVNSTTIFNINLPHNVIVPSVCNICSLIIECDYKSPIAKAAPNKVRKLGLLADFNTIFLTHFKLVLLVSWKLKL